jgi:hypothetical protein
MLTMATGNRVHNPDTRANDSYNTPAVAVRALLAVEDVPRTVWEPCAGGGYIVSALQDGGRRVVATDLTKRKRSFDCVGGVDFLKQTTMPCLDDDAYPAQAIFTNPPFKIAEEFVAHALDIAPKVYVLLRVGFLAGLRWKKRGFAKHCRRVHVFSPRLPMMHRKNHKGAKNENSAMDFAWYVFDVRGARQQIMFDMRATRGFEPKGPEINWLDWRDYATAEEIADVKRRRREAARAKRELAEAA